MKKYKKCIELIILCTIIIFSFFASSFILERQGSSNELRVRNFYRIEKNSLDVVLVGSSLFYNGYSSPLAWNQQKIKSYVLATSGVPMGVLKSMIQEVRRTQDPKVILIDLNSVLYDEKMETREGMTRYWIDNMPTTPNKDEVLNELIPTSDQDTYRYPILKYHEKWKNIPSCLKTAYLDLQSELTKNHLVVYGMQTSTRKPNRKNIVSVSKFHKKRNLYKLSGDRFQNLLDYLKKEGITDKVAFVAMPKFYDEKHLYERELLNQAIEIARNKNIKVYDFDMETKKMNLDVNHDYFDRDHLNMFGQEKTTTYLCRLLKKDFNLKENYSDRQKQMWDQEYESYQKMYALFRNKWNEDEDFTINYKNIDEVIR